MDPAHCLHAEQVIVPEGWECLACGTVSAEYMRPGFEAYHRRATPEAVRRHIAAMRARLCSRG